MKLNDNYFLNPAHLELAKARYFLKDDDGELAEQDIDEVFNRVVNYVYRDDKEHKEEALRLRREKKIIDAGRPLAQAGTGISNLYNCFVLAFGDETNKDPDTREAISELKRKHFNIQAQGGGTGISFSSLRPAGSICKKNQSRSSGAVGFITDISYQSSNIEQGGNRSGANLGVLDDWHPDLYDFITHKTKSNWENIRKFATVYDEDGFSYFQWENPHQWQMFNVSVMLSDEFIKRVIKNNNDPWKLYWGSTEWYLWKFKNTRGPRTGQKYDREIIVTAPNEELAFYKAKSKTPFFNKNGLELVDGPYHMSAPEWFDLICKSAHEDGCPGILFTDMAKRYHNGEYFNPLSAANPCIPGDQWLLTDRGFRTFSELYESNEKLNIVQDERVTYEGPDQDNNNPIFWKVCDDRKKTGHVINSSSHVFLTKTNADIVKVTTKQGMEIRCTPDHHIATRKRGLVTATELKEDDEILVANTKIWKDVDKGSSDFKAGFLYGHFIGDGHYHKGMNGCEHIILGLWGEQTDLLSTIDRYINDLYDEKDEEFKEYAGTRQIKPYFVSNIKNKNMKQLRVISTFLMRFFRHHGISDCVDKYLFNNGNLNTKDFYAGLISGLIETDGTVLYGNKNKNFSLRINSSNKKLLKHIQRACLQFGSFGKIYLRRKACAQLMPDGHENQKEYFRKDNYEIIFSGLSRDNLYKEIELFGVKKQKYTKYSSMCTKKAHMSYYAKVKCVEADGKEDVFCLSEKNRRTMVVNGITVRRCAEEPLPANGVCCLASVILPSFFRDGEFQWDDFEIAIKQAVRGLDNVISLSKTGESLIDDNALKERRIGLGTTGGAELLIMAGLKYSNQKGRDFIAKVMEFFRDKAYEASIELAKERGAFPAYEYKGFSQSAFFKILPERIQNLIRRHGIRNVTVLCQAPVGTTGTMLGYSTGCEPYFAMSFLRNSRVGSFLDGSPSFMRWLNDNDINYTDYNYSLAELRKKVDVPDYFEEAHEISWEDHLKMQAIFSKYIDASVSKTINMPNNITVDDVKNVYITAYKMGIKSTTIYRDGSKQQVLEIAGKESDKRPNDIVRAHAPKRPFELPCDIHHTSVRGDKWTVLVGLLDGRPYEVFCAPQDNFEIAPKYKSGVMVKNGGGSYYLDTGDFKLKNISSYLNTDEHKVITRLLSTCLRHGVPMPFISDQLAKADGTIVDFSKAILRVLKKYGDIPSHYNKKNKICEICGSSNIVVKSGCPECLDCGTSKCG